LTDDPINHKNTPPPVEEDLDWDHIPEIPEGARMVSTKVVFDKLVAQLNQRRAARRAQVDQEPGKNS
jgi:hypothetical protein